MNNELETIWKKAELARLKALFWHLPQGLRKYMKNLSQDNWFLY
jgi:hypothetical protein